MKENFVGHKFRLQNSKRTGITLEQSRLSSENMMEKYSASFDNESKIERLTKEQILFGEKVSKTDLFVRLLRDIQSLDEKTREFASEILCDFLEFDIINFDLEILKSGIEKVIDQIKVEENIDAEHKLVEGLFEFIWHKKITKKEEVVLLERLTEIDKYYVWSYLGDELIEDIEHYESEKLYKYYSENIQKWKEKDEQMYGKEKMEEYYNNLKQ